MTADDIKANHVYEAKRPARSGSIFAEVFNDRQVLWINQSRTEVQYDSPTLRAGRHYPHVSMEKFLKWAGRDVTDEMPPGGDDWRTFTQKPRKL